MTVLIADDDNSIRASARMLLKNEGLDCIEAEGIETAIALVREGRVSAALIDMNYCRDTTSGMEGLSLISSLKDIDADLPIVVMTGWGSVTLAVEAMRRGAADFIEKPWQNERLMAILRAQLELASSRKKQRNLLEENSLLRRDMGAETIPIAYSKAMRKLLDQIPRLAAADIPILITGENGTGKGLLAQYIHALSPRAHSTFMAVNMGGIAENVFESELFGHVKGAFTDAQENRVGRVELAQGGTLFLDEIANAPLSQQGKLLRLLEEKRYEKLGSSQPQSADVRILSATNANLDDAIARGSFRQDLLYRLQGITLHVPPLRERREDILPLAQALLARRARGPGDNAVFTDDAASALLNYAWPGNVRELQHVVERACLLADNAQISATDLQLPSAGSHANNGAADWAQLTLEQAEQRLIEAALRKHDGQANAAAKDLGLSRSAFYRRLDKYGITH